ncbi:hypothetical protein Agub_g6761 [Astrephomene gubernaculifera]|uniref:Polycystin cation channel PKD1/PKD2 domain-containing protein n=1 Tax=Astrephomene gubernaculifera TaxID=47775 RepID=A0AAD3DRI9_9CHLO|nr:hypothetical protein Agub_g6761 [Astrephomene gubernaculifera]
MLQGVVMVLLIVRWVHHLSFQPHLSIISGTLARMLPDLATFVLVMLVILVMFASLLQLLWGNVTAELATLSDAVIWAFSYSINGAGLDTLDATVMDPANQANAAYTFLGWVVCLLGPLLFYFTLINFVLALLFLPFGLLKAANKHEPWIWEQIRLLFLWYWQRLSGVAPSNKEMMKLVVHTLKHKASKPPKVTLPHLRISRRILHHSSADSDINTPVTSQGQVILEGLGPNQCAGGLAQQDSSRTPKVEVGGKRVSAQELEVLLGTLSHQQQHHGQQESSHQAVTLSPHSPSPASSTLPTSSPQRSLLVALVAAQLLKRLGKPLSSSQRGGDSSILQQQTGPAANAQADPEVKTGITGHAAQLSSSEQAGPVAEGLEAQPDGVESPVAEEPVVCFSEPSMSASPVAVTCNTTEPESAASPAAAVAMQRSRFGELNVILPGSIAPSPAVLELPADTTLPDVTANVTVVAVSGEHMHGVDSSTAAGTWREDPKGSDRHWPQISSGGAEPEQKPLSQQWRASQQGRLTFNLDRLRTELAGQRPAAGRRLMLHSLTGVAGRVPPSQTASVRPASGHRVSAWSCAGAYAGLRPAGTPDTATQSQPLQKKVSSSRFSAVVVPHKGPTAVAGASWEGPAASAAAEHGGTPTTFTSVVPLEDMPQGKLTRPDTHGAAWGVSGIDSIIRQEGRADLLGPQGLQQEQQGAQQLPLQPTQEEAVAVFAPPGRTWRALVVAAAATAAANASMNTTSSVAPLAQPSTACTSPAVAVPEDTRAGCQEEEGGSASGGSPAPPEIRANSVAAVPLERVKLPSSPAREGQPVEHQHQQQLQPLLASTGHQQQGQWLLQLPGVGDTDFCRRVADAAVALGMTSTVLAAIEALLKEYESLRAQQGSMQAEQQLLAAGLNYLIVRIAAVGRNKGWR